MNTTLHVEMNHKSNRFGNFQIYIRITTNGRIKRINTGIAVSQNQFDAYAKEKKWIKSTHPESEFYNQKIYHQKFNLSKQINSGEHRSIEQLIEAEKTQEQFVKRENFIEYAWNEYQGQLKNNHLRTAIKRRSNINRLIAFYNGQKLKDPMKSKKLPFDKITPHFLGEYKIWLIQKGLSINSIIGTIKDIRTMFNLAIREGVIDYGISPFINGKFKVGAMKPGGKEKLNAEELQAIIHYTPENEKIQEAKDYFLFSYFTYGMRCADIFMLKWDNIREGNRLCYVMSKNGKTVPEIILNNHALTIIKSYKNEKSAYIFRPLQKYDGISPISNAQSLKAIDSALAGINKNLKIIAMSCSIKKKVSMHVARHSFANQAKEDGVSIQVIKELLCHSDLATTYMYLSSFNNETLQQAGDLVYGRF